MWRGKFVSLGAYTRLLNQRRGKALTLSRSQTIFKIMVGKTYFIHNGKRYIKKPIVIDDVGYRLGEYVDTRVRHVFKKKKRK